MITVTIEKNDLDKLKSLFSALGENAPMAADGLMQTIASDLKFEFKQNLWERKLKLVPLKQSYLQNKISMHRFPQILISTSQMVASVEARKMENFVYFVGVPSGKVHKKTGIKLSDLAKIHEFGSIARGIPPRPAWALTAVRFEKQVPKIIDKFLTKFSKDLLGGKV